MKKVAVYGAGGHAKVVAEILVLNGFYVVGFIDGVSSHRKGESFCGSHVLGGDEVLEGLMSQGVRQIAASVGENKARVSIAAKLRQVGYQVVTAIHPCAHVSPASSVGVGTVVAAGAVIAPSAAVGSDVIVGPNASIDHDCVVCDGASIGPGAVLAGSSYVGGCAYVGAAAAVAARRRVEADEVIPIGAVLA